MRALRRPLFVGGLSVAIAATSLFGSSSIALAASKPSITVWGVSGPVYEGDRPYVTATFTDGTDQDAYTVEIDWGDGTDTEKYTLPVGAHTFGDPGLRKSVPYANDASGVSVVISLSDGLNATSRFIGLNVLNAAPSISSFALSSASVEAGQAVTATGAFADNGGLDTHTVTVDWGDLSSKTTLNLAASVSSFTTGAHTYTTANDFTVTATVADNAGASATATASVNVHQANQAPSIASFGVTAGNEGGSSTLALTFADADAADTHTVSVAWGDGATSDSGTLASTVTTFDTSHVYADTGTYSVVLTLPRLQRRRSGHHQGDRRRQGSGQVELDRGPRRSSEQPRARRPRGPGDRRARRREQHVERVIHRRRELGYAHGGDHLGRWPLGQRSPRIGRHVGNREPHVP